ncbi:hypothetical protein SDC9_77789 [bioreactor metagenome]|uniref:N-acetyltransferase domain-containing protein n=1 Tax=bioreactor metagenome TaxID=1076179 RepID=A0A644YRM6_9ZZZZ
MRTLETNRLILREWRESDLDDYFEYAQNPNVGPNAGWKPYSDKSEALKMLKTFIENDDLWAIVDKNLIKVIGSITLRNDEKRENTKTKMMGFVLSESYWGREIMLEAVKSVLQYGFEELKLELISVYHFPLNYQSKRVIEKAGFKFEGVLRDSFTNFNGLVYDDCCYSMKKSEYFEKKNRF